MDPRDPDELDVQIGLLFSVGSRAASRSGSLMLVRWQASLRSDLRAVVAQA